MSIIETVLLPPAALVVCITTHVLCARAGRISRPRTMLVGIVAGLGSMYVLTIPFTASEELSRYGPAWTVTYLCLAHCYFLGFYAIGESARRLRLLIELHSAGDRGMTQDEILSVYSAQMIIDLRLRRLISVGQVVERDGRYVIGRRTGLYVAQTVDWWGRLTHASAQRSQHT